MIFIDLAAITSQAPTSQDQSTCWKTAANRKLVNWDAVTSPEGEEFTCQGAL